MSTRGVLAAALSGLAACGRLGFDEQAGAPIDAADAIDAPPGIAFEPAIGNCDEAEAGPFREVATFAGVEGAYGVWAAPPFLLVADTVGGLRSLRFDGASLEQVGYLSGLGWVEGVWSDGDVFYVGAPGTGLYVVDVSATGALAILAQDLAGPVEARRGWVSDGVVYVPAGTELFAMRFDGAALQQLGAPLPTRSWAQGAWARGNRVLFADDVFRVVDFTANGFADAIAPSEAHLGTSRVWSDGEVIFTANTDGVTALRLDGATLTELDTFPIEGNTRDVWSDGQHVFVAAEATGFFALRFDGTAFTLVDRVITGASALGVFGDGDVIYASDLAGVHAYAGFACTRTR